MTARERRLRERIDVLADRVADLESGTAVSGLRGGRCGYCGTTCGRARACSEHRDLLRLDPFYSQRAAA